MAKSRALGKVARDVTLLAQGEVAEVREGGPPGRGGSSAIAHKHNPVAAVSVLACTRRVPGLVATMLVNMEQEHERAAGAWQAEWGTLSELLALTGSAAAWAAVGSSVRSDAPAAAGCVRTSSSPEIARIPETSADPDISGVSYISYTAGCGSS